MAPFSGPPSFLMALMPLWPHWVAWPPFLNGAPAAGVSRANARRAWGTTRHARQIRPQLWLSSLLHVGIGNTLQCTLCKVVHWQINLEWWTKSRRTLGLTSPRSSKRNLLQRNRFGMERTQNELLMGFQMAISPSSLIAGPSPVFWPGWEVSR